MAGVSPSSRFRNHTYGVMVFLSVLLWLSLAPANVVVQVRGTARLTASLDQQSPAGESWLRGHLLDDQGTPIPGVTLDVRSPDVDARSRPIAPIGSCSTLGGSKPLETRPDGTFCIRLSTAALTEIPTLVIEYPGSSSYDRARLEIATTDVRSTLVGRFLDLVPQVSLDEARLSFRVTVDRNGVEKAGTSEQLPLTLALSVPGDTSSPRLLRRLSIRPGEPLNVTLTRADLGAPGPAEFVLQFAGNARNQPLTTTYPILRVVRVGVVPIKWPTRVAASQKVSLTFATSSPMGQVGFGAIQLSFNGSSPRVMPLSKDGRATFVITTPKSSTPLALQALYLPDREGYWAKAPSEVTLSVEPASPWRAVLWLVPGLVVLAWLGLSRRNSVRSQREPEALPPPLPRAHVELLGPSSRQHFGWEGFLVDAHDGTAIREGLILLRERSFNNARAVHQTQSDRDGAFTLPIEAKDQNPLELVVQAPHYVEFRSELPEQGMLRIHLVTVRRSLLEKLVTWTRRRGMPYRAKSEPTPEWVARVARDRGQKDVEQWARALGTAAFQETPPTNSEEDHLVPPPGPTAPHDRSQDS